MLTTKSVFLVLDSAKVALHESEFRIILIYLPLDLPMSETSQFWLVAPCKQKIDHIKDILIPKILWVKIPCWCWRLEDNFQQI